MIMRSGLHAFCDRSKNKGRIRAWTARAARTARTARTHVRLFSLGETIYQTLN